MDKLRQAARLALEALEGGLWDYGPGQDEHDKCNEVITVLREALDHSGEANEMVEFFSKEMKNKISVARAEQTEQEPSCSQHPDAPHGFARNASHNAGRYVCECEGWEPEQAEQEPMKECRHCGFLCKPNSNESRKWYPLEQAEQHPMDYDQGFVDGVEEGRRQIIEQAEQEPVAWGVDWGKDSDQSCVSIIKKHSDGTTEVVAVEYSPNPVRTKDLTDAHILVLWQETANPDAHRIERFARAVIAADREKNK